MKHYNLFRVKIFQILTNKINYTNPEVFAVIITNVM
jgi:hypothetical protein